MRRRRPRSLIIIGTAVMAAAALGIGQPTIAAAAPHGPGADGPATSGPRVPFSATSPADSDLYQPPTDDKGFKPLDATAPAGRSSEKLGAHDTQVLQQAQATKAKTVTVMLLADSGNTKEVSAAVAKAGGTVGKVQPEIGYVRATVPTGKVQSLAALPVVKAIDLDKTYRVPSPQLGNAVSPVDAKTGAAHPAAPNATTPADNPYLPVNDIGATDFVAANHKSDGRGITVGVLDTGVDLDHAALQKTSDGRPKVVDWVTATDPVTDGDGTWVQMSKAVTGPRFDYAGATWTAPEGKFQLGLFYEMATTQSDFGGDLNNNGSTNDRFGVLYDPQTHQVWVDSDGDHDFTDTPAMSPYGRQRQIGHFGTEDPQTAVTERIPFVVEYRDNVDLSPLGGSNVGKVMNYVNIGLPSGAHGSHVAGIIAGTSLLGGAMHGVAPGAQIVSSRACTWGGGCTEAALTEGMIDLVVNRGVDVVNLSVGGLPALNDGSDVISQLYNKLTSRFGVQIVVAAGNEGAGTNTVGSPSVSSSVLAVAASVSKKTWWADYGSAVDAPQGLFGFSSHGPSEDGALAPAVSAPGAAVSSIPGWLEGQAVPEAGYSLPVGYGMMNGTSMAAPQVTGAAALLLSAAKSRNVEAGPTALRSVLTGTATPIDGVPTTAQGAGLVNIPAAWKMLSKGVRTNNFDVSAPVCTALSGNLATPNRGAGIYNRCLPGSGGQPVGTDKSYRVTVTRTNGKAGHTTSRIGWVGNDGTFRAPKTLSSTLGASNTVTVTATPKTTGVHSAIMTIDDPTTTGIDRFVAVTVLAAKPLSGPTYQVRKAGTLGRTGTTSFLVAVPEGVEALQLNLAGQAEGSQMRVLPVDPDGIPADSNASDHCYTGYPDPAGCDPKSRAVLRPKAGIWEFVVEARRTSSVARNPFTATVALQGMSFAPDVTTLQSATVHQKESVQFTGTNTWGTAKLHATDGELGFVRNLFSTVANGQLTSNRVDVPRQSTRLDVALTSRADDADLDMYIVGARGIVGTSMNIGPGVERIVLDDPAPGTYFVVVTGADVPSGPATFDYHEEMFSRGIGTIAATSDKASLLRPGQSMPVAAGIDLSAVTQTTEPVIGRVRVANADGTIVGAATVRINSVVAPKMEALKWEKPFVGAKLTNNGTVAGDRQVNAKMTPTTWTKDAGFTDLNLGTGAYGSALDMNERQEAAGMLHYKDGSDRPATWAADGNVTDLGLPEWREKAYSSGYATGISDGGTVVGFASLEYQDENSQGHTYVDPFSWTKTGGFTKLAQLSANTTETQPRAINAQGVAVGSSLTTEGAQRAVSWNTSTGRVTNLGTLSGQSNSVALGVNAAGSVVGASGDDAFVWTPSAGMKRLPDYGFNATAEKITSDGWILGTVELQPDFEVAALWDPQGRLWDLSSMIPGNDWFLPTYSFGINDQHDLMIYGEGGPKGSSSSTVLLHIPDLIAK
ncbi:S8 family serine peptidase [Streptomyces sp. NBC_01387]|uniref:S8 family serine peptidase n=1 Tax=Streptomyces sp. NBC_01387 TaxID=2903849 RepID=UPI0032442991